MKKESNVPLLLTLSSKKCSRCGQVKPTTEFSRNKRWGKYGFYVYCRDCRSEIDKKYFLENTEKCKKKNRNKILKKYGITVEDQDRMLKEQNNKCAICGKEIFLFSTSKNLIAHVDHNHKTGKIRGLLCHDCNVGLGNFKDNTEYLLGAISYLNKNT